MTYQWPNPKQSKEVKIEMEECLFCKIAKKEIPSEIVFENTRIVAFKDISPQAPVHILVAVKEHLRSVMDLTAESKEVLLDIFLAVKQIAKDQGIEERGFRVITNTGPDSGQEIDHLHFHLLGGKRLGKLVQSQ